MTGWSLRTRVALAAALPTAVLAVIAALVVGAVLAGAESRRLDQQLTAVATGVAAQRRGDGVPGFAALADSARGRAILARLTPGLVVVVARDGQVVATDGVDGVPAGLPVPAVGTTEFTVSGTGYRAVTVAVSNDASVTAAAPDGATRAQVRRIRWIALLVGVLAALVAAAIGWVAAGRATRPLGVLAARTRDLPARPGDPGAVAALTAPPVSATPETAAVGAALSGLVHRVAAAQHDTDRALTAARDFAVSADHELRSPLTSMRTDLEVLAAHPDLDPADRAAVVTGLLRAQARVEATLGALGALADGRLTDPASFVQVDLPDVVSRAVDDARRGAPGVEIVVRQPDTEVFLHGSPGGWRLVFDNLLANAVVHGRPSRILVGVDVTPVSVVVTVDDDGTGVPPAERQSIFERFRRGSSAAPGGTGLGLALVAAQVQAHGGRVWIVDPPWGRGTRVVIEIPLAPWAAARPLS